MSDVTLKEHLEVRIAELEKRSEIIQENQRENLLYAKKELDIRLEGMNEVREQLAEQARTFLPAKTWEIQHQYVLDRIEDLKTWKEQQIGKQARSNLIATTSAAIALISVIVALIHLLK